MNAAKNYTYLVISFCLALLLAKAVESGIYPYFVQVNGSNENDL